jgi:uncharacterized protein YidB (DUF937 family)
VLAETLKLKGRELNVMAAEMRNSMTTVITQGSAALPSVMDSLEMNGQLLQHYHQVGSEAYMP